jgi:hypothetical protein
MPVSDVSTQEVILESGDREWPGILVQLTVSESTLTGSGGIATVDVEGTSYTLAVTCTPTPDVSALDPEVLGAEVKVALSDVAP